ncbi:unnamed protein product [Rotaria sordida]|uniref:Uncharacterized protein n=1 Tax=Rotaria sordida TaxID=392033 RepID=A0A815LQ85_9BILA|nr:unnamed protein product [Rotaria sordida]
MARKIAYREQRGDVCVMPYGISTMGAFAFIYAIVLPTYNQCLLTRNKAHCEELAYYVALASNFAVGIILLLLCIVGEFIRRNTPRVALLSSLSGLGFAYLAMNECLPVIANPIVSFIPFFIIMVGYFGEVSFGPIPVVVVALVTGTSLGWATSLNDVAQVRDAYELMKGYKLIFPIREMFKHMDEIMPYLSTTIPTAIANAIVTIQCVESARQAGDFYPTQEAMFADGIGTLISSFFGSFLSMTTYIGHPAMKKMGAKQGYSLQSIRSLFLLVC